MGGYTTVRKRSISLATASAVLLSSAALSLAATGSAAAAPAATTTAADVAAAGGMVVDGPLDRVFVGDSSDGDILATDYNGALVGSTTGISGVSDLTVSADGSTLYAAAQTSHQIVALNASTLAVEARYSIATNQGPTYVAFAGGKVWFTYGNQWDGNLGSVDPTVNPSGSTSPVTLGQFPRQGPSIWGPGILSTNPAEPGVLAVGETGLSSDSMAVVDVSGATPQLTAWYQGDYNLNSGISAINLVPGGSQVLVNGTHLDAYANGKFTAAGTYPTGQLADIDAAGLVAQVNGASVAVYRPNSSQPLHSYALNSSNPSGGYGYAAPYVRWAPDSSRLFALVRTAAGYTVEVLSDPTLSEPTLTVHAPATATRGKALTVTGNLSAAVPLPAGTPLRITRTDLLDPNGKSLPGVQVKADGSFSFTDVPSAGGTVTYKVSYAGDAQHEPVSVSANVNVPRAAVVLTLNNNGASYNYGTKVTFTAHLGATYRNRTVAIWAKAAGAGQQNRLLRSATVNSSGNLTATVSVTRNTAVTAVYAGDDRTSAKSVSSLVGSRVQDSTAVSGAYRTGNIGSTSYHWVHKSTSPVLTTAMTYYPGRAERLDVQVLVNGHWYSGDSEYFKLGTSGRCAVSMGTPGRAGVQARVRSDYIYGGSGDNVNVTTYGPWVYLYFTN